MLSIPILDTTNFLSISAFITVLKCLLQIPFTSSLPLTSTPSTLLSTLQHHSWCSHLSPNLFPKKLRMSLVFLRQLQTNSSILSLLISNPAPPCHPRANSKLPPVYGCVYPPSEEVLAAGKANPALILGGTRAPDCLLGGSSHHK